MRGRTIIEKLGADSAEGLTYQLELVNCGKVNCRKCLGGASHGPYWYVYWKDNGRTRSGYIGRYLDVDKGAELVKLKGKSSKRRRGGIRR